MARQLIKYGCANNDVLYLQQSLNKLGYEVVHHHDQRDGSYIYIKW